MKIKTIKVGPLETNCYLVWDEGSSEALVIDPGDDAARIVKEINENKLTVGYIVNTHGHYDHVGANSALKKATGALLLQPHSDAAMATETDPAPADKLLKDGDIIKISRIEFSIIHTPGHTPGGICLYNEKEKVLFSGDTLFQGGYGRTDLPGSSPAEMRKSLKKLLALPPETVVYPGHEEASTIGSEQNLLSML